MEEQCFVITEHAFENPSLTFASLIHLKIKGKILHAFKSVAEGPWT